MYLIDGNIKDCAGCMACKSICPKGCIETVTDPYGFVFPKVDQSACIECHRCEAVCPIENISKRKLDDQEPEIIAAFVKDDNLRIQSASGGAFTEIVKAFLRCGEGYIWGAAFDVQLNVKHICSFGEEKLDLLRGSKYVQSDTGEVYRPIREQLINGKRVLFSGTPCQVAALLNYLDGCDTSNLYCVDLLCHGAPSQTIFDSYIKEESKRYHSRVVGVQFRFRLHKHNKWSTRNMQLTTEDGKRHIQERYRNNYLRAYHPCLMNRLSCYECVFATPERLGDLTIGDFWDINNYYPKLSVEHGVSIIQANSEEGLILMNSLKENMMWYPIEYDDFKNKTYNALACNAGIPLNPKREMFLEDWLTNGMKHAVNTIYPMHADWKRKIISEMVWAGIRLVKKVIKGSKGKANEKI